VNPRRWVVVLSALAIVAVLVGLIGWRLLRALPTPVSAVTRDSWTADATVHSELLGRDMPMEVFQPPAERCLPTALLVLFHGRGGDQRQWMEGVSGDGVGIDATAHRLMTEGRLSPVVIASADIDDSYGVDSPPASDGYDHGLYERYIVDELIPALRSTYGGSLPIFVGGLSMGGFAALNAGFGHPENFAGIGALSPAFFVTPPADRSWIYTANDRESLFTLAAEGAADSERVFLGYGTSDYDWIRAATAQLSDQLVFRGAADAATVVPGQHETATWRALAEPMLMTLLANRPEQATPEPC
jgi:enterochelin esterase-like enzyme